MLRPEPDSTPVIDAKAFLWRAEPTASEGHPVFFEEVHLHVGGQAASHLASIVGPFVLADLPVVMWFPDVAPRPRRPAACGWPTRSWWTPVLVVPDAGRHGPLIPDAPRAGQPPAGGGPVLGAPATLARAAGGPVRARAQPAVRSGRPFGFVTGKPGPRHILGGWLMAQLDLRARELVLTDSKHVDITLEALCEGEEGKFQVKRDDGARAVWAKASLSNGISHSQALPLPDDSLTSALSRRPSPTCGPTGSGNERWRRLQLWPP